MVSILLSNIAILQNDNAPINSVKQIQPLSENQQNII